MFDESFDRDPPTHVVATRPRPGVADADEAGTLAVENRVVEVAMRYGNAVHLRLDEGVLAETAPDRLSTARERLDRLGESARILHDGPEYRASIPEDAAAVRACLAVEPDATDAWLARLHGVAEIAVLASGSWLYRSVPHHAHVREVNATPVDGFRDDVAGELESIPGSGLVPSGALVSWRSGGDDYELAWDALRRRSAGGPRSAFELERLRAVRPAPERRELLFRWESAAAGSWLRRALDRPSLDPPSRVGVPDRETGAAVVDALRDLRRRLDYGYAIAPP